MGTAANGPFVDMMRNLVLDWLDQQPRSMPGRNVFMIKNKFAALPLSTGPPRLSLFGNDPLPPFLQSCFAPCPRPTDGDRARGKAVGAERAARSALRLE